MENTTSPHWLSKDERKLLLIHYYKNQQLKNDFSKRLCGKVKYEIDELVIAFEAQDIKWYVLNYVNPSGRQSEHQYCYQLAANVYNSKMLERKRYHIYNLFADLEDAGLIMRMIGGHGSLFRDNPVYVEFTRNGYVLAQQYSMAWYRFRIWYVAKLRHHPILVVAAFFLGFVSSIFARLIAEWLRT